MELLFELFITVSLSFMFKFLFSKLLPVASMSDNLQKPKIPNSLTKSISNPDSGLRSLANSFEKEEMIDKDSVEVRRFERMPAAIEHLKFRESDVEESKRPVEFYREIVVSDVNPEYFEYRCLKRGICEIEIESVAEIEAITESENEDKGEDPDSEMGDWEAIERADLEELLRGADIDISD